MKVRIGFGLGTRSLTNDDRFGPFVDDLERLRFDSLWLSERIGGESPDPVVGMAYAAGRTKKLKFGASVMVLPGRNPVLVAKSMASLDRMSGGRLLPAFGLGVADAHEQQAFGIERGGRAAWFDEALPLMRRLWTEDAVDHDGALFHLEGIGVLPKPVQKAPRSVDGRDRAVRASAHRAVVRRLAAVVHRARRGRGREGSRRRKPRPSTSARSIPSTSAR